MKRLSLSLILLVPLLAFSSNRAVAQETVKGSAYQITLPSKWSRTDSVPQGFDVGFRKALSRGSQATLHLHYETMPAEAGRPPPDTSDMKRQWDTMVRNQFPGARSVTANRPTVSGRILINGSYDLTDGGTTVRRRYTYFLAGRTAFVVQCSAPPSAWDTAVKDFDRMLASLKPGGGKTPQKAKTGEAATAELKRSLPTLLGSFPSGWACTLADVSITPGTPQVKRTLEIGLSFERADIDTIYRATKLLFGMMKTGKSDADMSTIPAALRTATSESSGFVNYVGQVWGCAWGYVPNCDPAIETFKVSITDSGGKKVGALSISREDGEAILAGKVTASDVSRIASMYTFSNAEGTDASRVLPDRSADRRPAGGGGTPLHVHLVFGDSRGQGGLKQPGAEVLDAAGVAEGGVVNVENVSGRVLRNIRVEVAGMDGEKVTARRSQALDPGTLAPGQTGVWGIRYPPSSGRRTVRYPPDVGVGLRPLSFTFFAAGVGRLTVMEKRDYETADPEVPEIRPAEEKTSAEQVSRSSTLSGSDTWKVTDILVGNVVPNLESAVEAVVVSTVPYVFVTVRFRQVPNQQALPQFTLINDGNVPVAKLHASVGAGSIRPRSRHAHNPALDHLKDQR